MRNSLSDTQRRDAFGAQRAPPLAPRKHVYDNSKVGTFFVAGNYKYGFAFMKSIFVSNICLWKPNPQDLSAAPKLEFTEPVFRRRLSQLSKMTIQVVHDFFQAGIDRSTKIVFSSMRGEIAREYKINETLIKDGEILPASFSLSTFNAPIALATIAENLRGGYSAVYPSQGNFSDALLAACAAVLCGREKQVAFVYAEELVPECYAEIFRGENSPLAFAALLSASSQNSDLDVQFNLENLPKTPQEFLSYGRKPD